MWRHHLTTTTGQKVQPIFAEAWASLTASDRQQLEERVDRARARHLAITSQYDLQIQHYRRYGSRRIKERAAVSPDAFVQMALQLAASRYFFPESTTVATYESTQTRRFRHGRTETTRSVSPQSVEFCRAMNGIRDNGKNEHHQNHQQQQRRDALELLRTACDAHSEYTRQAAAGLGCDRHFFGLENICRQRDDDNAVPDLFRHPLYARSKRWLLSTSTLPGTAPGFGPVEEDGIGVGYDIQPEHVVLTCTCRKQHNDAVRFRDQVGVALDDMMALVDGASGSSRSDQPIRSKL